MAQRTTGEIATDEARCLLRELKAAETIGNLQIVVSAFQTMIDLGISKGVDAAMQGVDKAFDEFEERISKNDGSK